MGFFSGGGGDWVTLESTGGNMKVMGGSERVKWRGGRLGRRDRERELQPYTFERPEEYASPCEPKG